jgi:hypothetical protein
MHQTAKNGDESVLPFAPLSFCLRVSPVDMTGLLLRRPNKRLSPEVPPTAVHVLV